MFGNNKKTDELIKKYNSQLDRRLEQLKEAKQNMKDNNKMGATLNTIRDLLRTYNSQQGRYVSSGDLNLEKVQSQENVQSPEKGGQPGSYASSTEYCDDPSKAGEEFCDPPQESQGQDRDSSNSDPQQDQSSSRPRAMDRWKAARDVTKKQGVVSHWRNELEEARLIEKAMEQQGLTKPQLQLEALQKERDAAGQITSDKPGIGDQGDDDFVDDLPGKTLKLSIIN